MARKRKQQVNHRAAVKSARAARAAAATTFAPLFAHSPEARWRWFLPCLLAAFLLRAGAGLAGEWFIRADELFQYTEQAHRLVFGYGQVPWEFSMGARTWLLPLFAAAPMFLCKLLGFGHPDFYIPAVKIWHALLSLAIPAGMYLFGRRIIGETAARLALLFGCFWHEFIILSTHTIAEQYGTIVFFVALALLVPAASAVRLLGVGFLLGLIVAMRLPYLPLVGVLGLILLTAYPLRRWYFALIGGVLALVFWGAFEYFTWGRWWHSPRFYADLFFFNDSLEAMGFSAHPFYRHLIFQAKSSYGLFVLALAALFNWRRHWVLLVIAATVFLFHSALRNQEYTNLFVLPPLLFMLIASVTHEFSLAGGGRGARRFAKTWVGGLAAVITLGLFAAGVPGKLTNYSGSHYGYGIHLTPRQYGFFHSELSLQLMQDLARRPPGEVRAVLSGLDVLASGGYYYFHHRVPMLFPGFPQHARLLEERGPVNLASHIITNADANLPGFSRDRVFGPFAIFVNDTPETVGVLEDFVTNWENPFERNIPAAAKQHGIWLLGPLQMPLFDNKQD